MGNSYLKAFLRQGVENYRFADFVYLLDGGRRVRTLHEHYVELQEINAELPIWRPEKFVNCKHHDLSDDECGQLLELYRNALMPRMAIDSGAIRNPDILARSIASRSSADTSSFLHGSANKTIV